MVIRVYFKYNKSVKRADSKGLTAEEVKRICNSLNSSEEYIPIGKDIIICKQEVLCIMFYDD